MLGAACQFWIRDNQIHVVDWHAERLKKGYRPVVCGTNQRKWTAIFDYIFMHR